jgi:hypothetical protein
VRVGFVNAIAAALPVPTETCPEWARWSLGVRAAATLIGECPGCGATASVTADPDGSPLAIGGIAHETGCPAIDPRLEELTEDDVELRVFVLEIPDEAAA